MKQLDENSTLPHAPMFEKSVLSVILQDPEMLDEAPHLTDSHFHGLGHPEMFRRMVRLIRESQSGPIDSVSLFDEMARSGNIERIGGRAALAEIFTYSPSSQYFKSHLEKLNHFLARRMALKLAAGIQEAATSSEEISDLIENLSAPVTQIHEVLAEAKPPASTKALVKASLQRFLDRANGKESPMGISTGIADLDLHLKGIMPGRVWVIGAYTSGGKSVLASQILTHVVTGGTPGIYILLEMTENDVADRIIIQASKAPALAFTDPKTFASERGKSGPTEDIRRKLEHGASAVLSSPLLIRKTKNTLSAILSAIRKAHREMGAVVAVVDYVQLIKGGNAVSKEQDLSEISRSFSEISHELGMHILLLSQLSLDGDTKHARSVEEDSDAFVQVVQEMDKKKQNFRQHLYTLIAKDRHHGSGGTRIPLILDKDIIRFVPGYPEKANRPLAPF